VWVVKGSSPDLLEGHFFLDTCALFKSNMSPLEFGEQCLLWRIQGALFILINNNQFIHNYGLSWAQYAMQ